MNIRPATVDDVPLVLPMVNAIGQMHEALDPAKYGFRKTPADLYRDWLIARADDPRSVFLVADRDTEATAPLPVGFLIATVEREIPIYRVREFGFIHDLWIDPGYRHEGLARRMVMLTIERFREIGVRQIRLDTAAENSAARQLFQSCEFRASTIEMLLEIDPPG